MGAMNSLYMEYGDYFSEVFKTITVDNGSEFIRSLTAAATSLTDRPCGSIRNQGFMGHYLPRGVQPALAICEIFYIANK